MAGNTQPQPIVSNMQGTMTDTQGKPVETSGPAPEVTPVAFSEIESKLNDSNIPEAERKQFAEKFVTDHLQQNPELVQGFRDAQAGKNTPQAQAYQAKFKAAIDAHIQQQVQADPEKASTPQGYGEMVNNAMSTFQNMPLPLQAMVGIGLPMGLIGIMSSLFGGGGMGMGIMGALGLGAGVLGGAAGGMFGQGAQNMTADAAYNMGSFLGMIPEGKQDLSMLTADDPIAAIKAKGSGGFSPAAIKEQLAKAEQQKQQLATLMRLPEGMRPRMLQNLSDTNMTDEQAVRAAQNAAMLHGHLNDPKSELSQMQQQGQRYVDDPVSTFATEILPQKAYNAAQSAAQGAYDYTIGNSRMPWNWGNNQQQQIAQAQPGTVKGSSDMNINKLVEKWAFNDMDAKELSDLKAEKAKGAPYRVDSARREHELNLRNQAKPAAKKTIVVMCMKSARCWAGYEPVPGKKPYSNDSCRPVGSGKKKTDKKKKSDK
jgi:hypothetical protein